MKNLKQVCNKYVIVIGILIIIAFLIGGIIISNENNSVEEQFNSKNELIESEDFSGQGDSMDFSEIMTSEEN